MKFQIISHAGLLVESAGVSLLMDPWIIGSTYWRSWWNYPPVSRELIDSLKPDHIYLTHLHWDHFQGPSLRRFGKQQHILVPRTPDPRMMRDLDKMGFHNVTEIPHGGHVDLARGFRISSYQFNLFADSALVIEGDGVTLLNANDSKFMGEPLGQILRSHGPIDFVFRSHSSANSRLCYEITDDPQAAVDDEAAYVKDFADFAVASGCRYAVPFASNHCHLHKDVVRFNPLIITPHEVARYFRDADIRSPEVKIMVTGDSWSSDTGFDIPPNDFFENRERHLIEYAERNRETLERFYAKEAEGHISVRDLSGFFAQFSKALPRVVRRYFKGAPIHYVLTAGTTTYRMVVDLYNGTVAQDTSPEGSVRAIEIHTSVYVFRQCLLLHLFSHLSISKRVRYRVTSKSKKHVQMLNLLFNLYEYDMLPVRRLFTRRSLSVWLRRWREWSLYARIATSVALHGEFRMSRYLPAPRPHKDLSSSRP